MMLNSGRGVGGGGGRGGGGATGTMEKQELSLPILLAERVAKAVREAESFKLECADVGKQAEHLAAMLRSSARVAAASPSPSYDRPLRRVLAEAIKALERALALVRRCRRAGFLCRVVTITTGSTDFRKALALLDASAADLRWLLSIYSDEDGGGFAISLPPIASTDPILAWVWSYATTVQSPARAPTDRAHAAQALATLALDNDRNKKIILEEGGVPPLLALLRDGPSVESQIAAATALSNLASDADNVSVILEEIAVPIIVHVLSDSPISLQTQVAGLVSRLAAHQPVAQDEFARENAIRPLVSLLCIGVPLDDIRPTQRKPSSIHSLVQGMGVPSSNSNASGSGGGSRSSFLLRDYYLQHRKDRENESPEAKFALKVACADALWMLAKGCLSNCRKITETKGLLCLSKIIELEKGELQQRCMMTVMEIAAAAETDADLRRSAFRTNSPAARSVVEQLIQVSQLGSSVVLQIAAIKAIGCLARTFPAKETKVLRPLVLQLGHWNPEVAAEAAKALGKFANPENFNCVEHSKTITEFAAVPVLMRLHRSGEKAQLPAVILLSYLALHIPKSEALERPKVLGALQSVAGSPLAQDSSLRDMLPRAIYQLEFYQVGLHSHRQMYEL
ncbi:armadillo beta-catenin repeat family protein [Musa troglodytarum]|uniref:Armadillo beta-catenin repeat family protein n=1 Tax=Musa troglodytarum TaxID=320322 RepID=A0A9E7ETY8_9LILI|nr:armadillo beta-catenin repeat family protein [Musa troglodytarum]URD81798.1 armadillo beta-catenin repeat family protein [Musa troglodytarum]